MTITIYQLCVCLILHSPIIFVTAVKELKLLHVLSPNKFYVPDYNYSSIPYEVPKNLTYEYFIKNAVDMPNSAKMDLYNLGVHLRQLYDSFLGPFYTDEVTKMYTTEFPVSIIAGQLLNAGLWPPAGPQIWNDDLNWQPIPFEYTPASEDTVLLGTLCPNFQFQTARVLKNHKNLSTSEKNVLNYLAKEAQINLTSSMEIPLLYYSLENSLELKQKIPQWAKNMSIEDFRKAVLAVYELLSKTKIQRQLNGGAFIKKVIKNIEDYIEGRISKDRKINIYTGDDRLFAGVLKNLNISQNELQSSNASLVFQLYAEDNKYFIQIVHRIGTENRAIMHTITGCGSYCPFENFTKLVADIIPEDDVVLCHSIDDTENLDDNSSSIQQTIYNPLLIIAFVVAIFTNVKIL